MIDLVFFIIFLAFVLILAIKNRKEIELKYLILIKRTKRFKRKIDEIAKKYEKFFRIYGFIAIFICAGASLFGFFMLVQNLYFSITHPQEALPSVGLVLPQIPGIRYPFPYIMGVPIGYWIISILTILFSHELSHALVARAERIKIKSFGVFLFLIFPGAFVEPDEEQLKKSKILTKLKVYASGSFGNFVAAGIIFLISFSLFRIVNLFLEPVGINYEVIENTPASQAKLYGTILSVNDERTRNIYEFIDAMIKVKPNETVRIETEFNTYEIKAISHPADPERGYIGIELRGNEIRFKGSYSKPNPLILKLLEWIFGSPLFSPFSPGLFSWILILNILVGIFNILPLKPLDGGLACEALMERIFKTRGRFYSNFISILTFSIILVSLIISLA